MGQEVRTEGKAKFRGKKKIGAGNNFTNSASILLGDPRLVLCPCRTHYFYAHISKFQERAIRETLRFIHHGSLPKYSSYQSH